MTNQEGFKIIGERANELAKRVDVQKKMIEIAKRDGKETAEKFLYNLAIATLIDAENK